MAPSIDGVEDSDIVIAGAGVAGLMAALSAAPKQVVILAKAPPGEGTASGWAQGGVAAAVGEDDSPQLHAADTVAAGAGLCDRRAVNVLTREGPDRVRQLIEWGVDFDPHLTKEAAHSRRRILHSGDASGAELVRTLVERARDAKHIRAVPAQAVEVAVHDGRATGFLALHTDGSKVLHRAGATVLATGGVGRLFSHTSNPPSATGDGLAMAARAGADLMDMEMVQFHPTCLDVGADPMPLLTEALRGEGALLLDSKGERFMAREHPLAELAPRDVVARAIWKRLQEGIHVFLDARGLSADRFPTVWELCRRHNLDPGKDLLPVSPAAHYHMGGVAVDLSGRTTLPDLWACGEVACTGAHGANRLASNSLLEALVFGGRVGEKLAGATLSNKTLAKPEQLSGLSAKFVEPKAGVRELMWDEVGLVRNESGLRAALDKLNTMAEEFPHSNTLLVARLITLGAMLRRESRGGHYRTDYPKRSGYLRRHIHMNMESLMTEEGALA